MDSLQQQVAQYIQKAIEVNVELADVEGQIAELQKELETRQAARGGFKAVQENEKAVQRTEAIMETRIANALVGARGRAVFVRGTRCHLAPP